MSEFKPLNLQSASFVSHILPNIRLRDYQVRAVIHMAMLDRQMLAFDTGLGKTVSVVAGLVARKNMGKNPRVLILCPLKGMHQVIKTINTYTRFRVSKLTGSQAGIDSFITNLDPDLDVLICNYEAFDNPKVLKIIHELTSDNYFNTVVLDEAHAIANIYKSNRNFFISNIVYRIPARYVMTATPIISEVVQYSILIAFLEDSLHELGRLNNRVKAGEYAHERVPHLVQFKERSEGYKVQLHTTPAIKFTGTSYGTEIFKYTRGSKNKELQDKLVELINSVDGKLLIFSHLKANHAYLAKVATEQGRRVGIISGDTTNSDAQDRFNSGDLDCVIFSIPTELNLPASGIILYDWTSMAHQAIGRGIRSESAEGYVAHIFLSETPKEVSLFENTVIKNSVYLDQAFGKQIHQLLELNKY